MVHKVLMCPPTYYDIEYSINPWMDTQNKVDRRKAEIQWQVVYSTLESLQVQIALIDPVLGLPDMTFAGDCGLAIDHVFLASNFRHPERQGETDVYVRWFGDQGYVVSRLPKEVFFEGLGDIICYDGDVLYGYGQRSSREALKYVIETFPQLNLICELELFDESFYHAGLAISLIGNRRILYFPGAFSKESQRILAQLDKALPVSEYDAKVNFVCNNVIASDKILVAGCSQELEAKLNDWGYQVVRIDMSEYKKSGASVRCLVCDLF